eukprot:6592950-Lingulodinium_polyedra.AAC.1
MGARRGRRVQRLAPDLRRRPDLLEGRARQRGRARGVRRPGGDTAFRGGHGLAVERCQEPTVGEHGRPAPMARRGRRR